MERQEVAIIFSHKKKKNACFDNKKKPEMNLLNLTNLGF